MIEIKSEFTLYKVDLASSSFFPRFRQATRNFQIDRPLGGSFCLYSVGVYTDSTISISAKGRRQRERESRWVGDARKEIGLDKIPTPQRPPPPPLFNQITYLFIKL